MLSGAGQALAETGKLTSARGSETQAGALGIPNGPRGSLPAQEIV